MNSSLIDLKENENSNLTTGYLQDMGEKPRPLAPFTDSKAITAAANLTSNVEDLAKFVSLQFKYEDEIPEQILKGSTLREMHRVHWLMPSWESGWGLGFGVRNHNDRTIAGHAGWVGGYRSYLMFCPEDKIGVIVLINTEDYSPFDIALKIFDLTADAILDNRPGPETEYYDPVWEKYTGRYNDTSNWRTDVIIRDHKLYFYDYSLPPTEDPQENLTRLYYVRDGEFKMTDYNGEPVIFEMNKNRQVNRIKMGENYLYPVIERMNEN